MRTTIDLSDDLLRKAKKRAADEGVPLRSLVEEALRRHLGGGRRSEGYRLEWSTARGRLQPGVDLNDRDALFDLMDGRR
jgi:Arc/MetJ family transcription regulator